MAANTQAENWWSARLQTSLAEKFIKIFDMEYDFLKIDLFESTHVGPIIRFWSKTSFSDQSIMLANMLSAELLESPKTHPSFKKFETKRLADGNIFQSQSTRIEVKVLPIPLKPD